MYPASNNIKKKEAADILRQARMGKSILTPVVCAFQHEMPVKMQRSKRDPKYTAATQDHLDNTDNAVDLELERMVTEFSASQDCPQAPDVRDGIYPLSDATWRSAHGGRR